MSIILSLILSLLVTFLEWLFKQWLGKTCTLTAADRKTFCAKMQWRIWLGPKRVAIAGALFDKAADRQKRLGLTLIRSASETALALCDGLTLTDEELAAL